MEVEGPDGSTIALIKNAMIPPLRERYTISVGDGLDLEVQGNIVDHEYDSVGETIPIGGAGLIVAEGRPPTRPASARDPRPLASTMPTRPGRIIPLGSCGSRALVVRSG